MPTYVLTCTDYDVDAQTCVAESYQPTPSLIPRLTVEQGSEIGLSILLSLVSVAAIKHFLNPNFIKGSS